MKPTSVIFLILSLVLIAAGTLTCILSGNLAEKRGEAIFAGEYDGAGNLIETYDFTGESLRKITLNLRECEVTIQGGSDRSYVEFVNFPRDGYAFSTVDSQLTFSDGIGLKSLYRNAGGNFEIYGLRYFLRTDLFGDNGKPKALHFYLAEGTQISQFSITASSGSVRAKNIAGVADYAVRLDCGDVSLTDIEGTGVTQITIGKGNFFLRTADPEGSYKITIEEGDAAICYPDQTRLQGTLMAPLGKIRFFEQVENGFYETDPSDAGTKILLTAQKGNIEISKTAAENPSKK